MANQYEEFEEYNFDDFGDDGSGGFQDSDRTNGKSRDPSMILAGSVVSGVREGFMDPKNQARFLRGVLPEGYQHTWDAVDKGVTGVKEIYDEGLKETRKIKKTLQTGVRRLLPGTKSILPKGVVDYLTEWSKDTDFQSDRRQDPESAEIAMASASIFAKYQEDQRQRDIEKSTKEDLRDTMTRKQFGANVAALVAINNNVGRLVSYQDQVAANFQQKSLELQYRHYFATRKLLDVTQQSLAQDRAAYEKMIHNTGLPDMVKQHNVEKAIDILKTQTFGRATDSMSQWYRGVGDRIINRSKENIRAFFNDLGASASNALLMGEMGAGALDMVNDLGGNNPNARRDLGLEIGGGMAGSMAAQWLMKKLMKPVRERILNNQTMGSSSNMLLRMATDMPGLLNDWTSQGSMRGGMLGRFEDFIKSSIGTSRRSDRIMSSSVSDLDKNAIWNVKSQKTLNEVIPAWLSKMHVELKGIRTGKKDEQREYYNFETNRFESEKDMKKSVLDDVYNKYDMEGLNRKIETTLNAIDPEVKLTEPARVALRKYIFKLAGDRKPFKMVNLVDENNFPRELNKWKAEIMPLAQQRFGFDPNAAVDDQGNFLNPFGPFSLQGDGQKHLLEFSRRFSLLQNGLPATLEAAIRQAKLGNQELLERTGVAKRDGGNYNLNMDALLERALGAGAPTPVPPPTPHATGGLHIDNSGGRSSRPRRGYGNLVRNGLIQGEGTGDSDSINMGSAQVSNREFIMDARSTAMPGVLPLLRYIRRLGSQGSKGGADIHEGGLDTASAVEKAVNRFHDDWKTASDRDNSVLNELVDLVRNGSKLKSTRRSRARPSDFVGPMPQGYGDDDFMGPPEQSRMDKLRSFGRGVRDLPKMTISELAQHIAGAGLSLFGGTVNELRRGGNRLSKASEAIGGAGQSIWGRLTRGYEEEKQQAMDIYVNGLDKAKLTYYGLTNELYVDVSTGRIIRQIEDITGEVKDKAGNVVLSAEDFAKGLHTPDFKPILTRLTDKFRSVSNVAMKPVLAMRSAAGKVKNFVFDALDSPEDLYVQPDMENPRLTARLMELGAYTLKETGEVISRLSQIKGAVMHGEKEVLSLEELPKLVDKEGKPIKSMKAVLRDLTKKVVKRGLGMAVKAGMKAKDMFFGTVDILKKMSFNPFKMFKGFSEDGEGVSIVNRQKSVVERLDAIHKLLEEKLECVCSDDVRKGKKSIKRRKFKGASVTEEPEDKNVTDGTVAKGSALDQDGDGDVDNSARDQQERRAKAAAGENEKTRWAKLTDALKGGAARAKEAAGGGIMGLLGMIPGVSRLAAGITTLIGGVVKGGKFVFDLLGKAKGLLGGGFFSKLIGGMGTVGRGLATAGRVAWAVGGSIARIGIGAVGGATLGTAALVAGGVYGAFKAYQYFTRDDHYLAQFRMAQYGFKPDDEDKVQKIAALEDLCMKVVRVSKGSPAQIGSGVKLEQAISIFGIDTNNKEELAKWVNWFTYRFKPIFLSHVDALFTLTGKYDIRKSDESLSKAQRISYIKKVHFSATGGQSPYDMTASPFSGEENVDVDKEKVKSIYADMLDEISEGADEVTKKDSEKPFTKKVADTAKEWWSKAKEMGAGAMAGISALAAKGAANAGAMWDAAKSKGSDLASGLGRGLANVGTSIAAGATAFSEGVRNTVGNVYQGAKNVVSTVVKKGNAILNRAKMMAEMVAQGITNPVEQAMILAQMHHESGGFTQLEENLNYRADVLMKLFGAAKRAGLATVQAVVGQGPAAIAELIYGNRPRDLGNTQPGDGYRFRGRGFTQLTGRVNYEQAGRALGIDLVNNPDLASTPEVAAKIAMWYWKNRVGSAGATGDVTAVTKRINGGTNGLSDRKGLFESYQKDIANGKVKVDGQSPMAAAGAAAGAVAVTTSVAKPSGTSSTTKTTTPPPSPTAGASSPTPATQPPAAQVPKGDMLAVATNQKMEDTANAAEAQRQAQTTRSDTGMDAVANILRESYRQHVMSVQRLTSIDETLGRMEKSLPELVKGFDKAKASPPAPVGNPSAGKPTSIPKEPVSMTKT